jgi:hypothetical protein
MEKAHLNKGLEKTLSIFRNEEGIIVVRKNQFGAEFKSIFETENGLKEYLDVYKSTSAIADYQLDVSDEFWPLVINHLNS